MDDWQLIETAPKDGTFIDCWFPHNGDTVQSRRVPACRWLEITDFNKPYPACNTGKFAWFAQSGGRAFRMDNPSHWRPLPKPPALTAG